MYSGTYKPISVGDSWLQCRGVVQFALPHPGQERLAGSNNVAALAGVAALDGVHVAGVHIQRYNVAIGPGDSLYNRTLLLYVCFVL